MKKSKESLRKFIRSTIVFPAVLSAAACIVRPSFPIDGGEIFSMFGFHLEMKVSSLRTLLQEKGMKPVKESPHHLLFSGSFEQDLEMTIWLMAAFNNNRLYEIKIDLESKAKEALVPYARTALELAQKTSLPVARGAVFEGFHFHMGEIFLKDGIFLSIGSYEANDGRGVVSIIFRKQSDFLHYEIEKQFHFEPGRRDPGRITAGELPDSIDGQKVFWPGDDKRIIPAKIGQIPLDARKVQGYLLMIGIVDSQGKIRKGYIRHSTSPEMTAAVRQAIPQVRCEPATLEGRPVPSYMIIIINVRSER